MLILTLRTDKPESEITIFDDTKLLAQEKWQAHRQLAETIHKKLEQLLSAQGRTLSDVEAIVVFSGPGSYTGLRIGISVANALAAGLNIPIIGSNHEAWKETGMEKLANGGNDQQVLPEYGAPALTTQPQK